MLIYNGGILNTGSGIGMNQDCCCDQGEPPCESCLDLIGYTVDDPDPFYVAIALSEVTLSPDPVCTGQTATLTFKMLNATGENWPADCAPGAEADCAVTLDMFTSGTVLTVTGTTPGATVTNNAGDIRIDWFNQAFTIGEEKTYTVTFVYQNCTADLGLDCYYGRGYRGSITLDCTACPPPAGGLLYSGDMLEYNSDPLTYNPT